MGSPPGAEVIGRSLDESAAFGVINDRHAATLLRFLGRRIDLTNERSHHMLTLLRAKKHVQAFLKRFQ